MKLKLILYFLIVLFNLFVIGCFRGNDLHTQNAKKIFVKNNIVYYKGAPYAELRHFNDGICSNRGLSLYYYRENKEVWIHPEQGWIVKNISNGKRYKKISDIQKVWDINNRELRLLLGNNKVPSKEDLISSCSYDITISEDGRYIQYKSRGIFFEKTHKFYINLQGTDLLLNE